MQTALITGASAGIGLAFAQELASRQTNLVLVARSKTKLQRLAATLQNQFSVRVTVIVQDLTQPEAVTQVFKTVQQQGQQIDLLVNNAGGGDYGPFAERSRQRQSDIIKLNILALVELTHLFLPEMQQRGSGAIINLSSTSAFQAVPYLATYSASKAFVLHFSEALWVENKSKGVKILAVCPGPTKTDFFTSAEMDLHSVLMESQTYETAEDVVQEALKALAAGRSNVVTGGLRNRVVVNANRLVPRELLMRGLEKEFRPQPKPESP